MRRSLRGSNTTFFPDGHYRLSGLPPDLRKPGWGEGAQRGRPLEFSGPSGRFNLMSGCLNVSRTGKHSEQKILFAIKFSGDPISPDAGQEPW